MVASFSSQSVDTGEESCYTINATFTATDAASRSALMAARRLPALSRPLLRARLLAVADSVDTNAPFSSVASGAHCIATA